MHLFKKKGPTKSKRRGPTKSKKKGVTKSKKKKRRGQRGNYVPLKIELFLNIL
jgi:hypothetical protein